MSLGLSMPLFRGRLHVCLRGALGITSSAAGARSASAAVSQPSPTGTVSLGAAGSLASRLTLCRPPALAVTPCTLLRLLDLTTAHHGQVPLLSPRGPRRHLPSLRGPPVPLSLSHGRAPRDAAILGASLLQAVRFTLCHPLAPQPLPLPFSGSRSSLPLQCRVPQAAGAVGGGRRDTGLCLTRPPSLGLLTF
ncbi:hypothetical protein NDU88_006875 [Pleurodeles waltl]|uniref:Uncharacterized protein n=1 Tax=Pleurodeles waltl TaxID=8319 RepID=A0AAV7UP36_PLEWA|nr:hypothetical protein NDU88_006875 [Pleurodeles waltl]